VPTVLRSDGFEVVIYTRDHLPRHVHVFRAGGGIVINLDDLSVREAKNLSGRDSRKAQELVAQNREFLITEWERIGPIS